MQKELVDPEYYIPEGNKTVVLSHTGNLEIRCEDIWSARNALLAIVKARMDGNKK